jgi:hypothetical protein
MEGVATFKGLSSSPIVVVIMLIDISISNNDYYP